MREQDILRFLADLSPSQDFDDNSLIDQEIIELCRNLIKKNIFTLKDIPFELANTIANTFYKLCLFSKINRDVAFWLPRYHDTSEEEDVVENYIRFFKNYNKLKADIQSIPGFVNGLREIDRVNKPELYNYSVEYVTDCLKYDIENINFKDIFERRRDREIKKKYIREITDLVYILDV